MAVMAFQIFPKKIQRLWNLLDLRVAVLFSLFFQIILIFFASSRKRSGSLVTIAVIWSCYLLADWIAAYAVGIISNSQGEKCEKSNVNDELSAFWAPFLLLHLGGPDTITAFSLEDNELWIRHMLNVIVQVIAAGYVFMQSLPNKLWIPSVLMFLAGTIKYAERTRALYLACLGNLKDSLKPKPDPGPNYAQLMEEYSSNREAEVPEEIYIVPELEKATAASTEKNSLGEKEMIQHAYSFYNVFRGLIVDHMFSFHERNQSRKKFFSLHAVDAFKIMEIELNFLYDALYTKMEAVHHGFFGYFWRFLCSALLVAAFVLFASHHKPGIYQMPLDRAVTYALLVGAVILDFVALVKLIFSDWTVALAKQSRVLSILAIQPLLRKLKVTSCTLAIHKFISSRSRWSNCMYQLNLISYCLRERHLLLEKIAALVRLEELLDTLIYRSVSGVYYLDKDDGLKEFIFNELETKAKRAEDTKSAKEIYAARGGWTLLDSHCPNLVEQSVSEDVEYDESVLLWHIATEICFRDDNKKSSTDENRTRCKHLSDYMLYLFIMQPKLMLSVSGIAHIRFQDTCEEASKFFDRSQQKLTEKDACEKLIRVVTAVKPVEVKGDRSKSLLFDAVMLAKDLKDMLKNDSENTWKMMSKVWLELLCYAASHCRGDAHAQQLRQGGELITFVWLLMAHLGLGEQFRIHAGHARAKLIVEK